MRALRKTLLGVLGLLTIAISAVWVLNTRDEAAVTDVTGPDAAATAYGGSAAAGQVQRGAYLARAGNCMGCHTARGGEPYAGGRGIQTPFGTVFTSNLTPDATTGIGSWSPAHFWRAMHNGRSRDGRLLYPAFPYTSYTQVTREDSDALFTFLQSQRAVAQPNQPHAVRFPFDSQAALAVWRALYFKPGVYQQDTARNASWNRGAYLVGGLGHCSACHTARNALGATDGLNLAGGLIPVQNWYAPSLLSAQEASVAAWDRQDIVRLLRDGIAPAASVAGPMAEVVLGSTQYLTPQDLLAMADYLKALPPGQAGRVDTHPIAVMATSPSTASAVVSGAIALRGGQVYEQHCAQCHGDGGQGQSVNAADGKSRMNAYPALAGNRAVTLVSTANLVQIVLNGGYAPATAGNPRPFGMPPFVQQLDDSDVAAVLTHIRNSWGNQAGAVSALDVNRVRTARER